MATSSSTAKRRLLKEFSSLEKAGYAPEMDGDNISSWTCQLSFDPESDIGKKLAERGDKGYSDKFVVGFKFTSDYPMSSPLFYVHSPRISDRSKNYDEACFSSTSSTSEGWGFFQGVPCWHLLTNDGWTPACTTKTVLVQFHSMLSEAIVNIEMNDNVYSDPEAGKSMIKDFHPEWN